MKIVEWRNVDIEPKIGDKDRRQIFKTLLQRVIDERWRGKISDSKREYDKMEVPRVEIRKTLGDANVLMTVGVRTSSRWVQQSTDVVTLVSMNGTAELSEDDFIEMSLAAAEARGMYVALVEKDGEKE
jgi:hypothetical protein